MTDLKGEFDLNWSKIKATRDQAGSLEDLVATSPLPGLGDRPVDDFSSFRDEAGQPCAPYTRFLPFGPNSPEPNGTLQAGDVSTYVYGRRQERANLNELKQRGWHAEICFKDEQGRAGEMGPWSSDYVIPRLFEAAEHTKFINDFPHIFHIFRLRGQGVDDKRVAELVRALPAWCAVFSHFQFPQDGDPATGGHRYLDSADFATVKDLEEIARELIVRPHEVLPKIPPVTCAQWTYQVLCLALNFPLNEDNARRLNVLSEFKANWADKIPPVQPDLSGLGKLPFVPWSPAELVQHYLDSYMPGKDAVDFLTTPSDGRKVIADLLGLDPRLSALVKEYLGRLKVSRDPREPMVMPNGVTLRFVMPSSFYCEARRCPDAAGNPWFQYVATLVDERFVVRRK